MTAEMASITDQIRMWIRDSVAREEDRIRRPDGSRAVCPFAGNSLTSGHLDIVVLHDVSGMAVEEIESITLEHLRRFSAKFLSDVEVSQFATLILAFPDLRDDRSEMLDVVEKKLRLVALDHGLMLGQMHKSVPLRGLYSDSLDVFAPCELIKIRKMVVQDIVFLGRSCEQFRYYDAKFAECFAEGAPSVSQQIGILYRSARDRFGQRLYADQLVSYDR